MAAPSRPSSPSPPPPAVAPPQGRSIGLLHGAPQQLQPLAGLTTTITSSAPVPDLRAPPPPPPAALTSGLRPSCPIHPTSAVTSTRTSESPSMPPPPRAAPPSHLTTPFAPHRPPDLTLNAPSRARCPPFRPPPPPPPPPPPSPLSPRFLLRPATLAQLLGV